VCRCSGAGEFGLEEPLTAHLLPRMPVTSVSQISKNPPMASRAMIGPHSGALYKVDLTRMGIRQVHERNRQRVTQGLLTPQGAQYGAMEGKAEKRNGLSYAGFASLCKPLQRMNYHS
jgi:hypothetical protein